MLNKVSNFQKNIIKNTVSLVLPDFQNVGTQMLNKVSNFQKNILKILVGVKGSIIS